MRRWERVAPIVWIGLGLLWLGWSIYVGASLTSTDRYHSKIAPLWVLALPVSLWAIYHGASRHRRHSSRDAYDDDGMVFLLSVVTVSGILFGVLFLTGVPTNVGCSLDVCTSNDTEYEATQFDRYTSVLIAWSLSCIALNRLLEGPNSWTRRLGRPGR